MCVVIASHRHQKINILNDLNDNSCNFFSLFVSYCYFISLMIRVQKCSVKLLVVFINTVFFWKKISELKLVSSMPAVARLKLVQQSLKSLGPWVGAYSQLSTYKSVWSTTLVFCLIVFTVHMTTSTVLTYVHRSLLCRDNNVIFPLKEQAHEIFNYFLQNSSFESVLFARPLVVFMLKFGLVCLQNN